MKNFDLFFSGYIECAAWSSSVVTDEGMDESLEGYYWDDNTLEKLRSECSVFYNENLTLLEKYCLETDNDMDEAGHDFWLTRNGHGAGFWVRGLDELGDELSDLSKSYGSVDLTLNENDEIIVI